MISIQPKVGMMAVGLTVIHDGDNPAMGTTVIL
jgi:hypothetical protein